MNRYLLALSSIALLAAAPPAAVAAPACVPAWTAQTVWDVGDATINSMASDPSGDAFAVGTTYIVDKAYLPFALRWNGTHWEHTTLASPGGNPGLGGVATLDATHAWAVGEYDLNSAAPEKTLVYDWNGTSWTRAAVPTWRSGPTFESSYLDGAAASSSSDVWAVGYYQVGPNNDPGVLHYNGSGWSIVPSAPGVTGELFGVAASSATNAWAVGQSYVDNGGTYTFSSLIEHWNGTAWSVSPTPTVSSSDSLVRVTIVAPNDVWALGSTSSGALALHWNGSKWSSVTVPSASGLSAAYALSPDDVWAAGENGQQPAIEHWNGTSWSLVPSAISEPSTDTGVLEGIAYSGGRLLAGGFMYPNGTNGYSTIGEDLCPTVLDNSGFSPSVARIQQGQTAWWTVNPGSATHSVTDESGLDLFASGLLQPGSAFDQTFGVAGGYRLTDTATGHTGELTVPVIVTPTSGTTSTSFTIQWASAALPPDYGVEVQVERPGTSTWVDWGGSPTTVTSASFTPDAGAGTYMFHARLFRFSNGAVSGWSAPGTLTVS